LGFKKISPNYEFFIGFNWFCNHIKLPVFSKNHRFFQKNTGFFKKPPVFSKNQGFSGSVCVCFTLVLMSFCQPRKAFAWVLRRFLQIMSFPLVLIGSATT